MGKHVKLLIAYILLVILGIFGAHKFYLRKYKTGTLYFFLFLFFIIIESVFNKPDFSGLILLVLLILIVIDFITLPFQIKKMSAKNEIKASDLTNKQNNKEQDRIIKELRKNAKTESKLKRKQEFQDRLKAKLAEKEEKREVKKKEKIDKVYKEAKNIKAEITNKQNLNIDDVLESVSIVTIKNKDKTLKYSINKQIIDADNYWEKERRSGEKQWRDGYRTLWKGNPIIIEFEYERYDDKTIQKRQLGVFRIAETDYGYLYIGGFCYLRNEERTFNVKRIREIICNGKTYAPMEWLIAYFIYDRWNSKFYLKENFSKNLNDAALDFYNYFKKNNIKLYKDYLDTAWIGEPLIIKFSYSTNYEPRNIKFGLYRIAKDEQNHLRLMGFCFDTGFEEFFQDERIISKINYKNEKYDLHDFLKQYCNIEWYSKKRIPVSNELKNKLSEYIKKNDYVDLNKKYGFSKDRINSWLSGKTKSIDSKSYSELITEIDLK